ncbi:phosphoenolpyruvate mutase [Microbulbifer sp.]|uniref:phosphoenolpyruvate mutase n=1 Tax=Microbulbifer sp. TaxID=1908541 RepID=UPI0025900016|nr:phosphoenolpyruvate mutase [Microbulbifer sp.]
MSTASLGSARASSLRQILKEKKCLRIIEAHSPLSALIGERTIANIAEGEQVTFDGFWSSSLTDSTLVGKPDIEVLGLSKRLDNIADIFEVTSKPMIIDADTGGLLEHFSINVRAMSLRGVSAVIIEDKIGLKKNSLLGNDVVQNQDNAEDFARKISAGKRAQANNDFMVIARIESLILEAGLEDALRRAKIYVGAGADGIMIHSRKEDPEEIFEFAQKFRSMFKDIPLICVPTSYNSVCFQDLEDAGFNIVIYANHMLRASYRAMQEVAHSILFNGRTLEVESECLSIKKILKLIPGTV